MKQINLLPKSQQKEFKLQLFTGQLIGFWIWVVITLLLFAGLSFAATIYLKNQVTVVDSEIELDKNILKSSDNSLLKQQVEGLNSQIHAVQSLQTQHYYWSTAMIELAKLLPADISVDTLTVDRATGQVNLSGTAKSRDSVLKFWADMHKTDFFKDINFPLGNLDKATDDPFSFTFYANTDKLKNP